jgi:hypothetical protein
MESVPALEERSASVQLILTIPEIQSSTEK